MSALSTLETRNIPIVGQTPCGSTSFGILSTYPPTPCGLATFSAALSKGLCANGSDVSVVRVADGSLSSDVRVIGELVGVPVEDRAAFQPLIRASTAGIEPGTSPQALRAAVDAIGELGAYFGELIARRRQEPADDLLTALAASGDADDRLSEQEIIATAILLFAAGFETTTNLIGNGMLALLQHPEQQQRWRDDQSVESTAVEELLR